MTHATSPDRKNVMDELDEIADLIVCAGMCTHSFDESDSLEASALRYLCDMAAARLRNVSESRERFHFPANEVSER